MNFLTVEEFAAKVKLHPTTVRKAIRHGKIYAAKVGIGVRTRYRIPESELERIHIQCMCESKKDK